MSVDSEPTSAADPRAAPGQAPTPRIRFVDAPATTFGTGLQGGPSVESEPAAAGETTPRRPRRALGLALVFGLEWLQARALFVTAVAAVVALSAAGIPNHLAQDGYLALVAGRIIAAHGVPHHDYLTVMAHGVRWIDQQWLAQLAMYGLEALGGLQLMTVVYVLITAFAFTGTIAAARRLGGRDIHVLAMLPLGTFFYMVTAVTIRTQGFAYPLFVSALWLLAAEARRPTRRRWLAVFPLLVVWANLHGSVTLGVAISVIYGVTVLAAAYQRSGLRGLADAKGLAFVLGSPLALFATPYGTAIVHYYRVTLFNSGFSKLVTEWQPVTSYTILAAPLLLLIFGTVWALGRSGRRTPAFDQLVLAVLALGAIDAVRNITWFGLSVIILLPVTITGLRPDAPVGLRRSRVNLVLASASIALAAIAVLAVVTHPTKWFQRTYPPRAVATVARIVAARPDTKIFADVRFADWLVWEDPALGGHIAYDTSLENLTEAQLSALSSLTIEHGPGVPNTLGPYSVLMLFPNPSNRSSNRILLAQRGVRMVLRTRNVIVATKPLG
jgi:hypothetical protein